MDQSLKTIVVGADFPALLLSASVMSKEPQARLGFLQAGMSSPQSDSFRVTQRFHEFLKRVVEPWQLDMNAFCEAFPDEYELVVGKKRLDIPRDQLLSERAFQFLGGKAAVELWQKLSLFNEEDGHKTLKAALGKNASRMFVKTFESLLCALDILEIQHSLVGTLQLSFDRFGCYAFQSQLRQLEMELKAKLESAEGFLALPKQQILRVTPVKEGSSVKGWEITTDQGSLKAENLVFACAPWQVSEWVQEQDLPDRVIKLELHTKPLSAVKLVQPLKEKVAPLVAGLLPNQAVQFEAFENQLVVWILIDFEHRIQASSVVKAIKRLKVNLARLESRFPFAEDSSFQIVLEPSHQDVATDLRYRKYRLESSVFPKHRLAFLGAGFGNSDDQEENVIRTIQSAQGMLESL